LVCPQYLFFLILELLVASPGSVLLRHVLLQASIVSNVLQLQSLSSLNSL
jgi:hypothetical protein